MRASTSTRNVFEDFVPSLYVDVVQPWLHSHTHPVPIHFFFWGGGINFGANTGKQSWQIIFALVLCQGVPT